MTLAEATSLFIEAQATGHTSPSARSSQAALRLLSEYFRKNTPITDLTLSGIREFLTRWYVDEAASPTNEVNSPNDLVPTPDELIDTLVQFFSWLDVKHGTNYSTRFSEILARIQTSLPKAIRLTRVLAETFRQRKGAFSFPEFLTSFEEGGRSEYDIDVAGGTTALDGYFRVTKVDGSSVEAVELLTEDAIAPIDFPADVAETVEVGYVINLEMVREQNRWKILGCGFAYPPEFEI